MRKGGSFSANVIRLDKPCCQAFQPAIGFFIQYGFFWQGFQDRLDLFFEPGMQNGIGRLGNTFDPHLPVAG